MSVTVHGVNEYIFSHGFLKLHSIKCFCSFTSRVTLWRIHYNTWRLSSFRWTCFAVRISSAVRLTSARSRVCVRFICLALLFVNFVFVLIRRRRSPWPYRTPNPISRLGSYRLTQPDREPTAAVGALRRRPVWCEMGTQVKCVPTATLLTSEPNDGGVTVILLLAWIITTPPCQSLVASGESETRTASDLT